MESANAGGVRLRLVNGEEIMVEKSEEKNLGDLISKDGRNLKNIQARINKGKGIVTTILNILEGIPFGKVYFKVAVILRNTLLVSSMLCNSEAWVNLTNSELDLLETVDVMLLRNILKAPVSTPKEMLFLELGVQPLREIVRGRRLNFLHYILNQDADSIISKVFEAQVRKRTKKDWISSVLSDLELLEMNVRFADIQIMSKSKWKSTVKRHIEERSLKYLNNLKQKHSKVNKLQHQKLRMQSYFLPSDSETSVENIHLIFQMRCNVTKLKMNLKGLYDTYECEVCLNKDESQEHIYKCEEIWKIRKESFIDNPNYENIMNGSAHQKLEVAKIFKENLKIHTTISKSK